jgi:hypothetical protein
MNCRHLGVIAAILVAMAPRPARAQETMKERATQVIERVGVHLNMSFRDPVDPDVTKGTTFGGSIGLSPGRRNGWRYPIGLTMFSEDLHGPNGETFAAMKTTAIIGGIGYGWHFGRLSTGVSLQGGYAFNHGQAKGDIQRAFDGAIGPVALHVDNSLILRPQVKAEYFMTPKLSLRASADYVLLQPEIAAITPAGQVVNRWRASNAHANVGIGWYPFRK